jgi:hypothetical protein
MKSVDWNRVAKKLNGWMFDQSTIGLGVDLWKESKDQTRWDATGNVSAVKSLPPAVV